MYRGNSTVNSRILLFVPQSNLSHNQMRLLSQPLILLAILLMLHPRSVLVPIIDYIIHAPYIGTHAAWSTSFLNSNRLYWHTSFILLLSLKLGFTETSSTMKFFPLDITYFDMTEVAREVVFYSLFIINLLVNS